MRANRASSRRRRRRRAPRATRRWRRRSARAPERFPPKRPVPGRRRCRCRCRCQCQCRNANAAAAAAANAAAAAGAAAGAHAGTAAGADRRVGQAGVRGGRLAPVELLLAHAQFPQQLRRPDRLGAPHLRILQDRPARRGRTRDHRDEVRIGRSHRRVRGRDEEVAQRATHHGEIGRRGHHPPDRLVSPVRREHVDEQRGDARDRVGILAVDQRAAAAVAQRRDPRAGAAHRRRERERPIVRERGQTRGIVVEDVDGQPGEAVLGALVRRAACDRLVIGHVVEDDHELRLLRAERGDLRELAPHDPGHRAALVGELPDRAIVRATTDDREPAGTDERGGEPTSVARSGRAFHAALPGLSSPRRAASESNRRGAGRPCPVLIVGAAFALPASEGTRAGSLRRL